MYQPRQDCVFFTKSGMCNHLDRRGLIFPQPCLLNDSFVKDCLERVRHKKPAAPPPPPTPRRENKCA